MTEFDKRVIEAGAGKRPDVVVAAELGATRRTVCWVRLRHGIKAFAGLYLTQEEEPCRSIYEAMYDAWLHSQGIEHRHEVRLRELGVVADFQVGDEFVEVVGMVGYPRYDARLAEKKRLYADAGLKVRYVTRQEARELYTACGVEVVVREQRLCSSCGKANHDLVKGLCRSPCYMDHWREQAPSRKCEKCGVDFPDGNGDGKFCSRRCYWQSMRQDMPPEEWFIEQSKTKSIRQLALELGLNPNTVHMRICRYRKRTSRPSES